MQKFDRNLIGQTWAPAGCFRFHHKHWITWQVKWRMMSHRYIHGLCQRVPQKRSYDGSFMSESSISFLSDVPSDTKAALGYVLSLFPREKYGSKLPAIGLKHQIYSIVEDRTVVDRELNTLRDSGEIRYFKLDCGSDEFAVVYSTEYKDTIKKCMQDCGLQEDPGVVKFLEDALPLVKDVSVEKSKMIKEFFLSDQVITSLINLGVLNMRDEKSFWISIPGSAPYMKSLIAGRKAVLSMVKKRKYKELFERELEERDVSIHSRLGMKYHILDIVGGDMVTKVPTTGGLLLRSVESKRRRKSKSKI